MRKVEDLQSGGNLFFVIGEVGTGKTSIAVSHPGKKVVFSFDASYASLDGVPDVDVYEPDMQDVATADKFIEQIKPLIADADLIVFDNLSALENNYIRASVKKIIGNNADSRSAYQSFQGFLIDLGFWCLKNCKQDVLFTTWIKTDDNEESKTYGKLIPDLNKKAFNVIAGYAKMVSRTVLDLDGFNVIVNVDGKGTIKNQLGKKITKRSIKNEEYWKAIDYARTNTRQGNK